VNDSTAIINSSYYNQYNRKYDERFTWYVHRIGTDKRFGSLNDEQRMVVYNEMKRVWTGSCSFTNQPIFLRNIKGKVTTSNPFEIASLDRIDNSKGYEPGNIQWVCLALNLARQNISLEEFKIHFDNFKKVLS
jgi:hypothetical protein